MNFHILSPLRHLFRKLGGSPNGDEFEPMEPPVPAHRRPLAMAPRPEATTATASVSPHNGSWLELPVQPILTALPLEVQARIIQADAGGLTFSVPLEKVLAQLPRGVVQICFGELRQAVPDLFSPENDRDRVLVNLPLGEILPRLNPALITRRRVQKQVEVPDEIASPFDQNNRCLAFAAAPAPAPAAAAAPLRPVRPAAPAGPAPMVPPARSSMTFVPPPTPPAALPPQPTAMSAAAQLLVPKPNHHAPAPPPTPAPPAPTPAAPLPSFCPEPVLSAPKLSMASPSAPAPAPAPVAAAPAATPEKPAATAPPLIVALTALAESWPEAVRKELVQLGLVDARVSLPADVIERGLKQGRVAFTWRALRSWIKPAPAASVSAHDSTVLELPLKLVAPMFLARQQEEARLKTKVVIDDDIPNLFFGFPQPEGASPTVASVATPGSTRPSDTNFYVWNDTNDRVRTDDSEAKRGPTPGTKFVAKYATPNEVVSRAAALDGVVGAIIALPDGLMVASRISADLNGDTLAAFLPQIYGKVNQCTKELRMGELNNVGFTVGNTPWKVFRVNAIFFAAFGRAGEPLPTAQLAALAAELDHKPK
jgi:predicted regulator of Ras-like GTPase activity (Roadblock/LC7/MglB family)